MSNPSSKQEAYLTRADTTVSTNISITISNASQEPTLQRRNPDPISSNGKPQESQNNHGKQRAAHSELDHNQAWMGSTAGSIDKPTTRPLQVNQRDRRPDALSKEDCPRETRPEMIDKKQRSELITQKIGLDLELLITV